MSRTHAVHINDRNVEKSLRAKGWTLLAFCGEWAVLAAPIQSANPHGTECKCDSCFYSGQGWQGKSENQPRPMTGREREARLAELDQSGPLGLLGTFAEGV